MSDDYYVYVYIDPRNFEEFYYGKGRGSRKKAHLEDDSDTPKVQRIRDILAAGARPIIRVIAAGLSERDALMIEATLLWKLGKYTTNLVAGHFTGNFRPHDTLHRELSGFDYANGLYYFNVGEGPRRNWKDCRRLGIASAGGISAKGKSWGDEITAFQAGDLIAAYVKGVGYVGVGRILCEAKPAREILIQGRPLLIECPCMLERADSDETTERVCLVEWLRAVDRDAALKASRAAGLFSSQLVRASLDNQPDTVAALESHFAVTFADLLR